MKNTNWKITTKRFVALFDIMGFKDLVERNSHNLVLNKLNKLKNASEIIENVNNNRGLGKIFKISETRTITFSDSLIIFSKGDKIGDICKLVADSAWLLTYSLRHGIPIKGALSYGEITVDFNNSLFFGRPIIDAYLLHDQLQLYAAILDNNFEARLNALQLPKDFPRIIFDYKANMKYGRTFHKIIPPGKETDGYKQNTEQVKKIYESVSGSPRIYVDNTLELLHFLETLEKNQTE